MVVFFEELNDLNCIMLDTLQTVDSECSAIVFKDEPFLPTKVFSIFEYFLNTHENTKPEEKDLFYVFLDVPDLWEIRAAGANGAIFNQGEKVASIYFKKPYERRCVQRVEWNTEQGNVYKVDFYNRYGVAYCSAYFDNEGKISSKVYYTSQKEEIINVNCSNGTVTLLNQGKAVSIFSSLEAFEQAALKIIIAENNEVALTSARQLEWFGSFRDKKQTLLVMLSKQSDVEMCREKKVSELLQTPIYIAANCQTKQGEVCVSENEYLIGHAVPKYPEVKGSSQAFILTALDNLEGIHELIESLPEITFHIAAKTMVSQKLSDLEKNKNVYVHPGISENELQELYETCDFYLDINWGREVDNAVIKATLNGMLVLGYKSLLHNEFYVLDECGFETNETAEFSRKLRNLAQNREELKLLVSKQQEQIREKMKQLVVWRNGNLRI